MMKISKIVMAVVLVGTMAACSRTPLDEAAETQMVVDATPASRETRAAASPQSTAKVTKITADIFKVCDEGRAIYVYDGSSGEGGLTAVENAKECSPDKKP